MFWPGSFVDSPQQRRSPYAFQEMDEDEPTYVHPAAHHHPWARTAGSRSAQPNPYSRIPTGAFAPSMRAAHTPRRKGPLFYWDPDVQRLIPVEQPEEMPTTPAKVRCLEFTGWFLQGREVVLPRTSGLYIIQRIVL